MNSSDPDMGAYVQKLRCLVDDLDRFSKYHEVPTPSATLNSWTVCNVPSLALTGISRGHPLLPDGRLIVSSQLFFLDERLKIARTLSRWYSLGDA